MIFMDLMAFPNSPLQCTKNLGKLVNTPVTAGGRDLASFEFRVGSVRTGEMCVAAKLAGTHAFDQPFDQPAPHFAYFP